MKNHTEVIVAKLPQCDFCKLEPGAIYQEACFDGATIMGPWANMCNEHFEVYGIGLGLGRGQQLVLKK